MFAIWSKTGLNTTVSSLLSDFFICFVLINGVASGDKDIRAGKTG